MKITYKTFYNDALTIYLYDSSFFFMFKKNIAFFRFLLFSIILFNIQCKKTEDLITETQIEDNKETAIITIQDISSIKFTEYALSDLAQKEITNWEKFKQLNIEIENLKIGTLSFFKDDKIILQGFITDLKNEVPENLNRSSILARLSVLETAMYKFDETANLQSSSKEAIIRDLKNLLLAYNNCVYQINKVIEKDSQKIIKP